MNLTIRRRVDESGRIAIPANFRKRMGIRPGDRVVFQMEGDELCVRSFKANLERAQQLARKHVKSSTSLVDELIAERRKQKSP